MRRSSQIVLLAASRFYMPLIVLFAGLLLTMLPAGSGVGLIAGLAFALMLALHAMVFGAAAARAAMPPVVMRSLLCLGFLAALIGAGVPAWPFAGHLIEGGLFVTSASSAALMLAVLVGRAPSLRDEDW